MIGNKQATKPQTESLVENWTSIVLNILMDAAESNAFPRGFSLEGVGLTSLKNGERIDINFRFNVGGAK